MIRRQFVKSAGLASGTLFVASLVNAVDVLGMPNEDNHLQIATDFDFANVIFDIDGYAALKDVRPALTSGQTYFWRQTVLLSGAHTLVYRGHLFGQQVPELIQSYNIELVPFAQTIKDEPVEPLETTFVCHTPPGNNSKAKTLEISTENLQGHLGHGDVAGACTTSKGADAVEKGEQLPSEFEMGQNYPNPVTRFTTIPITLPESARAQLTVYNMLGQRVETFLDADLSAGRHDLIWSRASLPAGTYMMVMKAGPFKQSRRLIVTN